LKVALAGTCKQLKNDLKKYGLELSENPEVVIVCGGDGTLLKTERAFPEIPKVFVKHCEAENCCQGILKNLRKKKFKIIEQIKVEGSVKGKKLVGMNEINIVSQTPIFAVRFDVSLNGRWIARNVIGDGVLVSTPYGSRAYFYSITRRTFKKGLGIAFNNTRKKIKPLVVNENSVIKVRILRDKACMVADNNPKFIPLKAGDVVTIKKFSKKARLVRI